MKKSHTYFKRLTMIALIACVSLHASEPWSWSGIAQSVNSTVKKYPVTSVVAGVVGLYALSSAWDVCSEAYYRVEPRKDLEGKKLPIVFSPDYDISFLGVEKLHPFDSKKYGKVHKYLVNQVGIPANCFHTPEPVNDQDLEKVHTKEYLEQTLKSSAQVARIAENPVLAYVPNGLVQRNLLNPMRMATGGTVLGGALAHEHGWAINLSGGYHHAKGCGRTPGCNDEGGGFCVFADIPLAINKLWEQHPKLKVLIVDLDAHQGNGHAQFFRNERDKKKEEKRVAIFDVYNADIYPHDVIASLYIDYEHKVRSGINDEAYLGLLKRELPKAIDDFKPDLIIYNAGTDVFEHDPLGKMSITKQGIIERDAFVFAQAEAHKASILMLLSGGYTKASADIIGQSIEHIMKDIKRVI